MPKEWAKAGYNLKVMADLAGKVLGSNRARRQGVRLKRWAGCELNRRGGLLDRPCYAIPAQNQHKDRLAKGRKYGRGERI